MARKNRRPKLTLYGTAWCHQSKSARRFLDSEGVSYRYVDIDNEPQAAEAAMKAARGNRSVPTFALPDGGYLVEPSRRELCAALDLPEPPRRWWWPF
jgi:mycoredoxin